jgi:hypothetical protein
VPELQLPQNLTTGLSEMAECLNRRGIKYALIGAVIPAGDERLDWLERAIAAFYDTTNGQAHG